MLLDAHELLGGTEGMAQVDLDVRRNRHKPLAELGPMADEVLRVVVDRLRAGRAAARRRGPATRGAPALREPAHRRLSGGRPLRLHGPRRHAARPRRVAVPRRRGRSSRCSPARALEACHRAGAEVVIKSGRRRAQVMEDARLLGQSAYIFEMGSGLVIDGELTWLTGEWAAGRGERPRADRRLRGARRCCWRSSRG